MKPVPKRKEVDVALRGVVQAVRGTLTALNRQAGSVIAAGKYDQAMAMAEKGREIKAFNAEVEALRKRWKVVAKGSPGGSGPKKARNSKTPLWQYYQPILRALDELGGEASRAELERAVERLMADGFEAGDRDPMSGNRERWQIMIIRSRKPLKSEGWIEPGGGPVWCITVAGRKAAKTEIPKAKRSQM